MSQDDGGLLKFFTVMTIFDGDPETVPSLSMTEFELMVHEDKVTEVDVSVVTVVYISINISYNE